MAQSGIVHIRVIGINPETNQRQRLSDAGINLPDEPTVPHPYEESTLWVRRRSPGHTYDYRILANPEDTYTIGFSVTVGSEVYEDFHDVPIIAIGNSLPYDFEIEIS